MAPKAPAGTGRAASSFTASSQAAAPQLQAPSDAEAELQKLQHQKSNGRAAWWSIFVPKLVTRPGGRQETVLECTECRTQLTTSNPSQLCGKHFKMHQKKATKAASQVAAASAAGDTLHEPLDAKRQRTESGRQSIYAFVATGSQIATFIYCLSMFFFTCNIALHLIENPWLVKACLAVSITLPCKYRVPCKY
jgi:hypothetical protein